MTEKRSPYVEPIPVPLARTAPRDAQRRGRSHSSHSLDAAAAGNFSTHPHREALDQHALGAADRRRGTALSDRAGAKLARAAKYSGLHPKPSWHRTIGAVCGLRLPVVAAAPAFPEYVLHAVHHAGWPSDPGRSSATLLEPRLYVGARLVPISGAGTEGPYLDRQKRFRHAADMARHSRPAPHARGCRAGGISPSTFYG